MNFHRIIHFVQVSACAIMVLGACSAVYAASMPLEELMTNMQKTYNETVDIKANFSQDTVIKSMNKKQREEGTVYFKKPRQMFWDYSKPKVKKLIINASKAWFYVPQDNAVYVQDGDKIFKSQLTVRFLSGIGNLQEDFNVTYANDDGVDGQGNYVLILKAKKSDLGVSHLKMTVDKGTYQILACSFTDAYGNDTRISFRNIKTNTALPDRLFQFKPPAKAEVFPMQ